MSELKGKVAVVTGANTGIGRVTAEALAKRGATVILACRSKEKTEPVIAEIERDTGNADLHFVKLDLGNFDSVRACARSLLDTDRPIHLLINNAGLAGKRGITESGFEQAFGVNHLGHFLFTTLLLDRLKASAPARIVNVASEAHYRVESVHDWKHVRESTPSVTGLPEYSVSKLANVLFTKSLAKRLEGSGVTTYALHPGVVASDVWRQVPWPFRSIIKLFMLSNEDGAATTLHCATSGEAAAQTGLYYDKCKVREPSELALDEALAEDLWQRSEAWVSA